MRSRARVWATLCGICLLGCPTEQTSTSTDSPPAPIGPTTAQIRKQAHAETLGQALPLVETLLRTHDPTGAAALGEGAPGTPPVSASRRAELARVRDAAAKIAKGLEPSLLPPAGGVIARAIAFELNRVRDELLRHRPSRTDPTWFLAEASRALDHLERNHDPAPRSLTDIGNFPRELEAAMADLGASSPASLAAARVDLEAVLLRYQALPLSPEATTALGKAAAAAREFLARAEQSLPEAQQITSGQETSPAKDPTRLARLPDRLGAATLMRRLEVEENLGEPPSRPLPRIGTRTSPHAFLGERPQRL